MDSPFDGSIDSNAYFQSLPAYVKESIKQSGIDFASEEELRACAEKLLKSD